MLLGGLVKRERINESRRLVEDHSNVEILDRCILLKIDDDIH